MSIDLQNLLERVEKLERRQAHLLTVLKDDDAPNRMFAALTDGDLPTVKALVELGLHDVNAPIKGRTPFSYAMDRYKDDNRGKFCDAAAANYLLDAGANPMGQDGPYDHAAKELRSMNDPTSVERLELLLRCEDALKAEDGYRGRGIEGLIVTRAIMAGRTDLIEPRHLEADVNDMACEVEKKYSSNNKNDPLNELSVQGRNSSLKLWLQPLNYLAIYGDDQQFLKALELGVPAAKSSVGHDGYSRYETLEPISTIEILECLKRDNCVLMLRAHLAAVEAQKALEEISEPVAGKKPAVKS